MDPPGPFAILPDMPAQDSKQTQRGGLLGVGLDGLVRLGARRFGALVDGHGVLPVSRPVVGGRLGQSDRFERVTSHAARRERRRSTRR